MLRLACTDRRQNVFGSDRRRLEQVPPECCATPPADGAAGTTDGAGHILLVQKPNSRCDLAKKRV
jgi:hypothetical protein